MKYISVILLTFVLNSNCIGQSKNFIDQPYLETTATVDSLVKPDIIYLDILINEKDRKNRISVEEMELSMIEVLTSLGIQTKEQLKLMDLSSNFTKYFLKRKDVHKSKGYSLNVHDAKTAGSVIVELEKIGISNVSLDKTEYSKMDDLILNLKLLAVEKALNQAEYLVKPLNQKITRALHITDKYYSLYADDGFLMDEIIVTAYSSKGKSSYEPPEIEFKPIRITSEVSVKFGIE